MRKGVIYIIKTYFEWEQPSFVYIFMKTFMLPYGNSEP